MTAHGTRASFSKSTHCLSVFDELGTIHRGTISLIRFRDVVSLRVRLVVSRSL
jgi:hypothetical protein